MRALLFVLILGCSSTPSTPKCGPENCAGCCREDGTCESDGTDDSHCGARGSLCADCSENLGFCSAGACTQCNAGTCPGCCGNRGHCYSGTETDGCGKNGVMCEGCPWTPGITEPTCIDGVCGTK